MKREAKHLLIRAVDSLVLAIEHFNRPHDRGRPEAVLILADHASEMFLKAAIVHKGGRIRRRKDPNTLGFEGCINSCLLDPKVKFLKNEEADTLRILNGLRDGAQHHFIIISEQQLYTVIQAAVTLFDEMLGRVFSRHLADYVPQRVLPISTLPPTDFPSLMDEEIASIRATFSKGSRRRSDARARIRTIALIDGALRQDPRHPSDAELHAKLADLGSGDWRKVFPGAASLTISSDGGGHPVSLRLTKTDGIPVQLVKEGDPSATITAVKRVDALSFYNRNLTSIAAEVGLSPPRTLAVVRFLKLQEDEECFKEFRIGKSIFHRYSPTAVGKIRESLPGLDLGKVWAQFGSMRRKVAT
jgi:uncharacterized protein DUF3644